MRAANVMSLQENAVDIISAFVGSDAGATCAGDVANMENVSEETITFLTTGGYNALHRALNIDLPAGSMVHVTIRLVTRL